MLSVLIRHLFTSTSYLLVILVVTIAVTMTDPSDPAKWNSTLHNDTVEIYMGAIGRIVPSRDKVGLDKLGRPKPQWLLIN